MYLWRSNSSVILANINKYHITLPKLVNAVKVFASFFVSKWLKKPLVWGRPISVSIEPTTHCNLGCPECPSGLRSFTRPTGSLANGNLKEWLSGLKKYTVNLTFYFQGEPFLHPDFLKLVKEASDMGFYTMTSTNAHFITEENAHDIIESGLDRIIISIDGTTQETYESYRKRGKLEKVISGTKALVAAKKAVAARTPEVVFQFLVVKPNEHQVSDVIGLGKELEVDDVKLKTAQIYDYKKGSPLIPSQQKYSRYREISPGNWEIKNPLKDHCWRMWSGCVITWDGRVVPCCFDKDAKYSMGQLSGSNFDEVWECEPYMKFRETILTNRKGVDICKNCTEGLQVWAD